MTKKTSEAFGGSENENSFVTAMVLIASCCNVTALGQ